MPSNDAPSPIFDVVAGLNAPRQRAFVVAYADCGNLVEALAEADIDAATAIRWYREPDSDQFRPAMAHAKRISNLRRLSQDPLEQLTIPFSSIVSRRRRHFVVILAYERQLAQACATAGVSFKQFRAWLLDDPAFKSACRQAILLSRWNPPGTNAVG